ncbi:MAG: hypothetical protein ACMUIU_10035 [bacterium]
MRRKLYILFVLFCTIFFLSLDFIVYSNTAADNAPRLTVSIFKYSGIRDENHEINFNAFKEIITAKMLRLAQEFETKDNNFNYISNLRPDFVTDLTSNKHLPFSGSQKDLFDHWDTSGALEVLLGRIRLNGSDFSVRSKIFLGNLKGNLKHPSIQLDLPIVDEQFDTTKDSHTVITLYALAMDAQQRGLPNDIILTFLSEAYVRLPDLPEDMPEINDLKEAIKKAIEQIQMNNNGR